MLLFFVLLVILLVSNYTHDKEKQATIQMLIGMSADDVQSFKIYPNIPVTADYQKTMKFAPNEILVKEFFQALHDSTPYQPQHDRALAYWNMEILGKHRIKIHCYIPDLQRQIAVGRITTDTTTEQGYVQSQQLLQWYQKYGQYWQIDDYQKILYGRVKFHLTSLDPHQIISFRVFRARARTASENVGTQELSVHTTHMTTFFEALEDIRFADQVNQERFEQWQIAIQTEALTIHVECFIPTDAPTTVIGRIEAYQEYTYFQSQLLYTWYHDMIQNGMDEGKISAENRENG